MFEVAGEELGTGLVDWGVPRMGFGIPEPAVQKPRTSDWAVLVGRLLEHIGHTDHKNGCPASLVGTCLRTLANLATHEVLAPYSAH